MKDLQLRQWSTVDGNAAICRQLSAISKAKSPAPGLEGPGAGLVSVTDGLLGYLVRFLVSCFSFLVGPII
jgi:hypothetical protein